jgi:ferritin-like metal-binding protein YciE
MEKMNDLKDLLKHEIEDLQSVEDQILDALPKMIDKANNPDLKKALQQHLQVTEQHKTRLEKIMSSMKPANENSNSKKGILGGIFGGGKQVCKGMKGIIEEGEKIMNSNISAEALDAAIIASAQKVEHYEICGYGTARTFALELGLQQIAKQLEQTLGEEYEANDLLTNLAIMGINEQAEGSLGAASSASSRGRSAGRMKEKARSEMEMEPVKANKSRSSAGSIAANESKTSSTNERGGQPKSTANPRSSSSSRTTNSSRKSASNQSVKSSSRNSERSSSHGRGSVKKTGKSR